MTKITVVDWSDKNAAVACERTSYSLLLAALRFKQASLFIHQVCLSKKGRGSPSGQCIRNPPCVDPELVLIDGENPIYSDSDLSLQLRKSSSRDCLERCRVPSATPGLADDLLWFIFVVSCTAILDRNS